MRLPEIDDEVLYQVLSRLEAAWLPDSQPTDGIHHAYDPLPLAIFRKGYLEIVKYAQGDIFCDVGCGMGTKLALMFYLGWRTLGIERWAPYAEAARKFAPESTVITGDAFDIAFSEADVIYAYRPMKSDEDELRLERHLIKSLKPGAVLWLPARVVEGDIGGVQVAPEVWIAS